jgi:hypothetical protein
MRAAEQHARDRIGGPQGLTFPIKLRCTSVADLLSEPGLEAGLARALGRAFARARLALPAPVAFGSGVALQAPYLTGSALGGAQASALLARIRTAIEAVAGAQSLPTAATSTARSQAQDRRPRRTEAEGNLPAEVAERFDPGRFDPEDAAYELPSYLGGRTRVGARNPSEPFARLLREFDINIRLLADLLTDQQKLGIANSNRISQWAVLQLALEDITGERRATNTVAKVLAKTLDPNTVTGEERDLADQVVRLYSSPGTPFPDREPLARRQWQLQRGAVLTNIVRLRVREFDSLAAEAAGAERDAFLDVGTYYLELLTALQSEAFERLSFLDTYYTDRQVIKSFAVVRYVRQTLPVLWDNLKFQSEYVIGDIAQTNFPAGGVDRFAEQAIGRALALQQILNDQQGASLYGDLPRVQSGLRQFPDRALVGKLSANILQLQVEVPALRMRWLAKQLQDVIGGELYLGVSILSGSKDRDDWSKSLGEIRSGCESEFGRRDHTDFEKTNASQWEQKLHDLYGKISKEKRDLLVRRAITEQVLLLLLATAVTAGVGTFVTEITNGSRWLVVLAEAATLTLFNAGTGYLAGQAPTAAALATQFGTNLLLAGLGQVFQALGTSIQAVQGLSTARRFLLLTTLKAGAFGATSLAQTTIQAIEAEAEGKGGETSFGEMLTLNLIMNGFGLLFGAALQPPQRGPTGRALALPTAQEVTAEWAAKGVPIDEAAAREWVDLAGRATEFQSRYQRLAKAAQAGRLTRDEFEKWRYEGLDLVDELARKLPRLAKVLGAEHSPEEISAILANLRTRLEHVSFTEPVLRLPQYSGLTQVGEGPTWTFDPADARAAALRRDYAARRDLIVSPLRGGGWEVTAQGKVVLQALPAGPAVSQTLPRPLDVVAAGPRAQEGLLRVRTQAAVPELPAQLAEAAAKFGANPVRRILQIFARGTAPPSDQAFRGLSNFVKSGGDPRVAARAVTIAGDRTGAYASNLFEQMASWENSTVRGLSTIYDVRPRTTGEEIGVLLGDFPPHDVREILQSIDQLAPHADKAGLRRLVGQLMREFVPPKRYRAGTVAASPTQIGARGTLATAVDLLKRFPGKSIDFEAPGLTPLGALRIEDVVIFDPVTRERIIGFEVKEVSSAFLGPRAAKQLAADIARDAAARSRSTELGVHRNPYETFRWRVRRYEVEADAAARLRSRGIDSPTPSQLDGEMRAMIRDNLRSAFDQAEFRNLSPAAQSEYRALFDQTTPFLEFDGAAANSPPPTPAAKTSATSPPPPPPKQSQRVLAPKEQLTRAQALESLEKKIETEGIAVRESQDRISALETKLKTLAANPVSRPPELDQDFRNLARIEDFEQRLAELDKLQQRPGLSSAAESYLKWLREVWTTRAELQDTTEGNRRVGEELERLRKVERPRAEAALRAASRAVKDFLRTEGPNYKKRRATVEYDEIIGKARWDAKWGASQGKRPALATDHLVALDRIANLSELIEFLLIYEKSSDAVKAKMTEDLIGLGDIESNLVRMRKDANESKSNKSWNDVTYEQMKKYGYENSDVDDTRKREGKELETIKQKIAEMTAKYR